MVSMALGGLSRRSNAGITVISLVFGVNFELRQHPFMGEGTDIQDRDRTFTIHPIQGSLDGLCMVNCSVLGHGAILTLA
jgi:hypothetical protein